jgi:hypothetical protein
MTQQATQPGRAAAGYFARARRRLATEATRVLFRRQFAVTTDVPLISFTFDDFPRSAFVEAGSILTRYGAVGTYYASLGLMVWTLPFLEHASRRIREVYRQEPTGADRTAPWKVL